MKICFLKKVSEENFNTLLEKIQKEQAGLKETVSRNEAKLADSKKMTEEAEAWIANIKEYADIHFNFKEIPEVETFRKK